MTGHESRTFAAEEERTQGERREERLGESSNVAETATIATTPRHSAGGSQHDGGREKLDSLCREYLAGNITRAEAVLIGTIDIQERAISDGEKQELQRYLIEVTDKGKGAEERHNSPERTEGELLEQILGGGNEQGGSGRDLEFGEEDGIRVVKKGRDAGGTSERAGKRVREEDLPWFPSTQHAKGRLTESMVETRALLRKYREDIDAVTESAQGAPDGPISFPASEWKNLLSGRAVNLDAVHSSIHTFKPLSESVGRVGPFEIRTEGVETSKQIQTAAQWISAWDETAQATEVAFPHRSVELRDYGRAIRKLFDAVATMFHHRIFLYDKAIRGSVRGGETLSLTDDFAFQHLYTADEKEGNRYVEASMGRGAPIEIADSNIPVESVETPGMDEMSVLRESQGMITRPRFLRFNCWNIEGKSLPRVVTWTLSAEPLPKTPILSPSHPISILLKQHPNLFPIVTPINVKAFRSYLERHPNRAFCESVCEGLEKGFWPWAKVDVEGYPLTHDEVREPEKELEKREFIRRQRDLEISKGRFSRSFGKKLLPGMYSMPTFAVPKEGSAKFRLVTDQSAGKFPVNGMQTPHEHAFPMDNMTQLGDRILRAHNQLQSGEHLVLFKSDVAEAYRLIPMSPVWQTRQINTVDGERFVDHNNVFGGKRSGDTFIAFMSLVLWAAETVWHIPGLCNYIDDVFTAVSSRQWRKYEPYNTVYPEFQTRLLECWDAIGIPHKKEKQLFGSSLTIIGIHVDAKNLTLSLAPERRADLLEELDRFIVRKKKGEQQKRFTLRSFLQLAGWLSWSFNVYPYLRPCLCNIYHKIGGLKRKDALVYTNRAISRELEWAERHIQNANYGTMFLEELQWPLDSADYTIFCDASGTGLGFWYPELNIGYTAYSPPNIPRNIYFGEGLCIAAALDDVRKRRSNCRVVVYTDNEASFRIFSSFHAVPEYNPILLFSAGLMMKYKLRVRVVWMPGKKNRVADALSRHNRDRAVSFAPGLLIHDFTPPYDAWAASALPWAVLQ
ncbi:hypothetical protein Agabi119p4_7862 [Agaricus bisporus var. burnettii]|uniref:Reverse transcriptase domain-containing protein n=1 Tax=Agaricus bisporus var. burnettii TaxID=192524 RepID=A0A8H7EZC3_AGABI|nr:hypothetical protein Agabi119p4_7862 [Agaricus bisporus var. burnettii]